MKRLMWLVRKHPKSVRVSDGRYMPYETYTIVCIYSVHADARSAADAKNKRASANHYSVGKLEWVE